MLEKVGQSMTWVLSLPVLLPLWHQLVVVALLQVVWAAPLSVHSVRHAQGLQVDPLALIHQSQEALYLALLPQFQGLGL